MNCTTHYACDCISAHRIELGNEVQRLKSALDVAVASLQGECCCPGERDYSGKEILCDPCEAFARIREIIKG